MTRVEIAFTLNRKPGLLAVDYDANQGASATGFDLFAGAGFDAQRCIGYPTLRAGIASYAGVGYAMACAWIQIVRRHEFASPEATTPTTVSATVDTHPSLAGLGVPFCGFGSPAAIFDAPCDNLNGLAKLEWLADTFLVTMPSRANAGVIARVASFRWGCVEWAVDDRHQVEISPLVVTDVSAWREYLPLLRSQFSHWHYEEAAE